MDFLYRTHPRITPYGILHGRDGVPYTLGYLWSDGLWGRDWLLIVHKFSHLPAESAMCIARIGSADSAADVSSHVASSK